MLEWVASIGLGAANSGTHSLRRTKAVLIYRRTGNLRAVELLLGHTKIESNARFLGIRSLTRSSNKQTWSAAHFTSQANMALRSVDRDVASHWPMPKFSANAVF